MKEVKTMTPNELTLLEIELTVKIEKTLASKQLKEVKKEIALRSKRDWRPAAVIAHDRTGKDSGMILKFGSPIVWTRKERQQTAKIIQAYSLSPVVNERDISAN
tara:strand:- start:366 stop:677 length:312 start_codon:yes stop_codon:yes gene_type:complete